MLLLSYQANYGVVAALIAHHLPNAPLEGDGASTHPGPSITGHWVGN